MWPFAGDVKMELLNQTNDDEHMTTSSSWIGASEKSTRKPVMGEVNGGRGSFISYADLEFQSGEDTETCYVKDDCIYLRILSASVASQCKPWLVCSPTVQESTVINVL